MEPYDINELNVSNWEGFRDSICIDGNRKALEALLYSFAILAWDRNKIIYFPIKNNILENIWGDNDNCDMVIMNNTVQFPRAQWIEVRRRIKKTKFETYVFSYKRERAEKCFNPVKEELYNKRQKYWQLLSRFVCDRRGDTIFYIFNKEMAKVIHLDLLKFLDRDLEADFVEGVGGQGCQIPFTCIFCYDEGSYSIAYGNVGFGFWDNSLQNL